MSKNYLTSSELAAELGFKCVGTVYNLKRTGVFEEGVHYVYAPTRGKKGQPRYNLDAIKSMGKITVSKNVPLYPLAVKRGRA